MIVKRLSTLVVYVFALGGALLLLCACAEGQRPRATATKVLPSATPAIPTAEPLSGPLPSIAPTGQPAASPTPATAPGPSAADLAIQIEGPAQIVPGETTLYTLTIRNHGPDPATGLVLTDLLPGGLTPRWIRPTPPMCEREGRHVGCDLGDLQGGDTATIGLDLSAGGSETVVTGTQPAGVRLELSVPTCTIVQDAAQPGVTCHLARLAPGAEARVEVGLDADAPPGDALHTVTVAANETDPNPEDNRATRTVTAGAPDGTPAAPEPGVTPAISTTVDLVIQADGPSRIIAEQPFTYTYTITNRGAAVASGMWFEDTLPPDLTLVAYAPAPPSCEQQGDTFTCALHNLAGGQVVTFTLVITGHAGQPASIDLDPLLPGWPICYVIKERTWLHIVQCTLGDLQPGQAIQVQLVLNAIGVQQRTTVNAASVSAREVDLNPADNTITTTMTVQAPVEP
ncbi:MAG: hypothetical protein PVF47_17875 [Anaerolineae bacterium]|jgi:uncharacterized repeat protein (TIGR01451 family)